MQGSGQDLQRENEKLRSELKRIQDKALKRIKELKEQDQMNQESKVGRHVHVLMQGGVPATHPTTPRVMDVCAIDNQKSKAGRICRGERSRSEQSRTQVLDKTRAVRFGRGPCLRVETKQRGG
jgi:hypothetical protein